MCITHSKGDCQLWPQLCDIHYLTIRYSRGIGELLRNHCAVGIHHTRHNLRITTKLHHQCELKQMRICVYV